MLVSVASSKLGQFNFTWLLQGVLCIHPISSLDCTSCPGLLPSHLLSMISMNFHTLKSLRVLEISKGPHVQNRHLPHHAMWFHLYGPHSVHFRNPRQLCQPLGLQSAVLSLFLDKETSATWDTWDQDGLHAIPLPIARTSSVAMEQ